MKRFTSPSSLAALLALGLAASATQAATPVAASMHITARAEVEGVTDVKTSSDSWGVPLSNLAIGALASVISPSNANASATSQGFGNASWTSANKGGVSFEGYGWSVSTSGGGSTSVGLTDAAPDWEYSFIAGATENLFTMAYNVFGTGNTFGLWGWAIVINGGPEGSQGLYPSNPSSPTTSGTFNASLTPGQAYSARLVNNANLGGMAGFNADGFMSGNFAWEVTMAPVPEPQTYALMAMGLAGMAFASRRRRRS